MRSSARNRPGRVVAVLVACWTVFTLSVLDGHLVADMAAWIASQGAVQESVAEPWHEHFVGTAGALVPGLDGCAACLILHGGFRAVENVGDPTHPAEGGGDGVCPDNGPARPHRPGIRPSSRAPPAA